MSTGKTTPSEQRAANLNITRRGFLAAGIATTAVAAGLGLAGCKGASKDAKGSGSAGGSSSSDLLKADKDGFVVRATKTDSKAKSNDATIAVETPVKELHPMNWSDGTSGNVVLYIYDSLLAYDKDMKFVPRLAKSWEISDDALTYTFHLRDDVTFTDGSAFDSSVVLTNYQQAIDKKNNWRRRRTFIETIDENTEVTRVNSAEAPDESTVVFHLAKPFAPFLNSMAQFFIISGKVVTDSSHDYMKESAGSGPFKLKEYSQGDHTTLVRNDDYWGKAPKIDSVTFREVPEAGSRIAMLQTGEVQVAYPVPADQVATIRSAGNINLLSIPSTTMRYVTLNNDVKPLDDVRVRQALNYALNQQDYVDVMYAGAATPATSVLPATVPGYKEQKPFDYDIEKAKSLLKEAGLEDGFSIEMIGDNSSQETKGMTFVMQQLAKINVKVDVKPGDAATNGVLAEASESETKLQTWYVNWSQTDADGFMRSLLSEAMVPPTGYNTAFWKNDKFNAELEAGNAAPTLEEQNKHYGACQDIAWDECPWIYLASDNSLIAYNSCLSNVTNPPQGLDIINEKLSV
ncbi:extracellular solute-binding protein family 5 [Coriobacterium glomerans PW2]|uniref:Glutathione-binding protein GsiB n=1 Tax=Coriobacterium glomerans (strain ATCC 49209 / DSM 20642 / JCM 10262 / PW2) TaxID=700015 RepID=F2N8D9_CORGP|nr:ABC transporter substrate-binding protein [Coriobacterium glomerans]AEB07322.1 extracellular solute-binding protein family 5 [Coriobacterium glomerans PW2]